MFNSGLYQFTAGRLELLYQQLCATTTQALVVMSNVIRPFDLYMLKKTYAHVPTGFTDASKGDFCETSVLATH